MNNLISILKQWLAYYSRKLPNEIIIDTSGSLQNFGYLLSMDLGKLKISKTLKFCYIHSIYDLQEHENVKGQVLQT